jgi:hypothetical protein
LSFNKGIKVERVVRSFGSCLAFRRTLWGDLAKDWFDLLTTIHNVNTCVCERDDRVRWRLGQKGITVKSLYNALQVRRPDRAFKQLWCMKLRGKIKIFLWVIMWGRTLTKDNWAKEDGMG